MLINWSCESLKASYYPNFDIQVLHAIPPSPSVRQRFQRFFETFTSSMHSASFLPQHADEEEVLTTASGRIGRIGGCGSPVKSEV